jgi:hypothetical protein
MNRRSQLLFEAPPILETTTCSELSDQQREFEDEWEVNMTSPKSAGSQLPDWARMFLKSVRSNSLKNLTPYIALFETFTFHPFPLSSSDPLIKVSDKLFLANFDLNVFRLELGRIRDARLFQNKNFAKLHENHRKLFQEVLISFTKFEPKDLEPILIDALLLPPSPAQSALFRGESLWNLGKRFAEKKLPKGLSTQVTKSAWYMQDAIFIQLGLDLREKALKYEAQNTDFKKKVEIARKARAKRP